VPSGTYSMTSATRIGAGISIGSELSLGPALALDLNVAYNLMNLSGKEWKNANPAANQRLDSYVSLNDAPDPNYVPGDGVHIISSERSIRSTAVTLSVLFGI